MRIDREEKRSLKRLFVGILVVALLVTMLPYGNIGAIVARAEGTSDLFTAVGITAEPIIIADKLDEAGETVLVSAEELFLEYMWNYSTETYPDGMLLQLDSDLDFSQLANSGKSASFDIYGMNIGIDMQGHSISNIYMSMASPASLETLEPEDYGNFIVVGQGANVFHFASPKGANVNETLPAEMEVQQGNQLLFSGVDVQNVNVTAVPGSSFGINGYYYNLGDGSDTNPANEYAFYNDGEGLFKFDQWNSILYVEELYEEVLQETTEFDVFYKSINNNINTIAEWISSYVYSDIAMKTIGDRTLIYNDEAYINPQVGVTVDSTYGVYNISTETNGDEVTKIMTIYAYNHSGTGTEDLMTDGEITGDTTGYVYISDSFAPSSEANPDYYDEVIFKEGSLPVYHTEYSSQQNEVVSVEITRVWMSVSQGENPTHFTFDFSDKDHVMQIFNDSMPTISVINKEGIENEVWAAYDGTFNGNYELVIDNATVSGADIWWLDNGRTYLKAGSSFVITPKENYSVYNVHLGNCERNINTGEVIYYTGTNLAPDYVEFSTNGEVTVTIPTHRIRFYADNAEMPKLTNYHNYLTFSETCVGDMDTWYDKDFKVNAIEGYDICDADNLASGWIDGGISVTEEGEHVKHFYLLDRNMVPDTNDIDGDGDTQELIPSPTYGQRSYIEYPYTMDKYSPVITEVTAVDAMGSQLKIDGGWYEAGAAVPQPEVVWTKAESVTLTATADKGNGLDIIGYLFDGTFQPENSHTYSGDGIYDIQVQVMDSFDKTCSRACAGVWIASFGIDTTAPTLLFTDAQTPNQKELKSDSTYAGNLHFVCEDGNGSGFAEINLYKQDGENWVAANELLIGTEEGSYIAPTTKDAVYRIEVTDVVGNTKVYEDITILGYTQDIDVVIGNTMTTYGKELSIPLTITNTTEKELQISLFALRDAATDSVFQKEIGTLTKLAAGETFKTTVIIPSGVDAGTYDAMLDIQYMSVGGTLETNIAKVHSRHIEGVIEKASGVASVIVQGFYYGETIHPVVASDTNGIENVVLYYREADAENSIFVKTVPTAVGTYDVRAVFPATKNYEEVTAESRFTITRMKATENMYAVSQPTGESGVYREDVIITGLEGNLLCTTEDGTYSEKLTVSETAENFSFYVKTSTGAITEKVELGKIVIERIVDGKGSVVVDDFYYGEKLTYTVSSDTNGTKNVTLYYKEKDAADRTYTKTAPSKVGSYVVKAVFAATGKYKEVIATDAFTITRMKATDKMYSIAAKADADGVYKENVVIKGEDDYLLSTSEKGTFTETLTISESTEKYVFYVKTSTGAITEKINLGKIVIDKSKEEESQEPEDTEEPEVPTPPVEEPTPEEEIAPTAIGVGRVRLESGKAYTFGRGTWSVSGDSTSYAGGITFYVPSTGDYEITQ